MKDEEREKINEFLANLNEWGYSFWIIKAVRTLIFKGTLSDEIKEQFVPKSTYGQGEEDYVRP